MCVCVVVGLAGFLVNGCGAKLPPRMTPLKTKPAVDIPRGSEVRVWNTALQTWIFLLRGKALELKHRSHAVRSLH